MWLLYKQGDYYNVAAITCTTYSHIHTIHNLPIGHSHNSLLKHFNYNIIAQLCINVHVTRHCPLAYKMCTLPDISRLHIECVCPSYCPVVT